MRCFDRLRRERGEGREAEARKYLPDGPPPGERPGAGPPRPPSPPESTMGSAWLLKEVLSRTETPVRSLDVIGLVVQHRERGAQRVPRVVRGGLHPHPVEEAGVRDAAVERAVVRRAAARHSDRAPVSAWKCVSTWRMMRRSAAEKWRWAWVKGSPLRRACRASPTDAIRRSSGAPPPARSRPRGAGGTSARRAPRTVPGPRTAPAPSPCTRRSGCSPRR